MLNIPAGVGIEDSVAGRIGRALAVLFEPLGFDWRISIALIPTMAAREVMVSSLATVYAVAAANDEVAGDVLRGLIAQDWSLATGLSLLVWFIYAPQCISTLATIRRETHSWKQVAIATGYLFGLAYLASLLTYQVAAALGAG
jgi:ferrous iron transport protein B